MMHTMLMASEDTATLCFKLRGVAINIAPVKKLVSLSLSLSLTEEQMERGIRKRELDELWNQYIKEKS